MVVEINKPATPPTVNEQIAANELEIDKFRNRAGRGPVQQVSLYRSLEYVDLSAEPKPVDWLIDGWLAKGDILLLAGRAGGGKSTTAVDLAISVAMRDSWMGGKVKNTGVLYLDEEAGPDEMLRQFQRQGAEKNWRLWVASSQKLRLDDQASIHRIEEAISDKSTGLLILDTASHFFMGADENSAPDIAERFLPLFKWRDTYGLTTIILHHLRKPPMNGQDDDLFDRIRGSTAYTTQASTVWTQVRPSNADHLNLVVEKRRGGRAHSACRIEYNETATGQVRLSYAGDAPKRETESMVCEQLITKTMRDTVKQRPVWRTVEINDVCEENGLPKRTSDRAIGTLKALGVIVQADKKGFYRLATPSIQPEMSGTGDDDV